MILDTIFILFFCFFPIVVFGAFHLVIGSLNKLSLPLFVLFFLFFSGYMGLLALYFEWDQYRVELGFTDSFLIIRVLLFSTACIFFTLVGLFIARICVGRLDCEPPPVTTWCAKSSPIVFWVFAGLTWICAAVFALYLSKLGSVALFVVFSEGSEAGHLARSLMTNAFDGKYHWYSLFMHQVFSFVCYVLFAVMLTRPSLRIRVLFVFAFSIAAFAKIVTTEKAPIVWFILGFLIVHITIRKNRALNPGMLFFGFSALLILVVGIHVFLLEKNWLDGLALVFSRAFTGSVTPAYWYLQFFPVERSWLYGASFPNPKGIFPFEPYILSQEVMAWKFPPSLNGGVVGSAPTIFWGELYANFGVFGVVAGSILTGFVIYLLAYGINQIKDEALKSGLFAWSCLHYKQLSETGLSGFLIDLNAATIFILAAMLGLIFHQKRKLELSRIN